MFEHRSPRAEEPGIGCEHLTELDEIILIATRSVQQEQRARIVALWRQIPMHIGGERVSHGWAPSRAALVLTHINVVEAR